MPDSAYRSSRRRGDKELVWLHGEVKSPPFTFEGRQQAGFLLRQLQKGLHLSAPHSRLLPSIGARCHELRVRDEVGFWRVIYRIDSDEIVIVDVHQKKTNRLPKRVIDACKRRLRAYDATER